MYHLHWPTRIDSQNYIERVVVELPEEEKHPTLALTWRRGRVVVEGTLCATPSTPIFIASLFSLHSVATCVFQDKSSTDKYTTATKKKKRNRDFAGGGWIFSWNGPGLVSHLDMGVFGSTFHGWALCTSLQLQAWCEHFAFLSQGLMEFEFACIVPNK